MKNESLINTFTFFIFDSFYFSFNIVWKSLFKIKLNLNLLKSSYEQWYN